MLSKRRGKCQIIKSYLLVKDRIHGEEFFGPLTDVKRIVERNRFGFQLVPREDFKRDSL
jgi:hypothetical protein